MEVKINCEANDYLDLNELMVIQGNLKDLTNDNFVRLRNDILKNGFISPFHIWKNDGQNKILDGTQRLRTLTAMKEQGYHIPKLPVVYISAETEKQAKEMIMSLTSQYGTMTEDGLHEFMEMANIDLTIDVLDDFRLPDINMDHFLGSFTDNHEPKEKKDRHCPHCGEKL